MENLSNGHLKKKPPWDDSFSSKAFNQGSDARITGDQLTENPYRKGDRHTWEQWEKGWLDVDRFWGIWARWPIRKLPEVRLG